MKTLCPICEKPIRAPDPFAADEAHGWQHCHFDCFFPEQPPEEIIVGKCGDANPKGNIEMTFKGGCRGELKLKDAYRCTGCGGMFHKDCILKHFELEEAHDWGRQEERKKFSAQLAKITKQKNGKKTNVKDHRARQGARVRNDRRAGPGSEIRC